MIGDMDRGYRSVEWQPVSPGAVGVEGCATTSPTGKVWASKGLFVDSLDSLDSLDSWVEETPCWLKWMLLDAVSSRDLETGRLGAWETGRLED